MVEPSQSARDAAGELLSVWGYGHASAKVRKGEADAEATVQAFAQAEQRSHAQGAAERAELVAARKNVFTLQTSMGVLCDALRKIAGKGGEAAVIAKAALNHKALSPPRVREGDEQQEDS